MLHLAEVNAAGLAIGTPFAILLLALGFGFVIFVHELGHFLAAKSVGIKCSQFAIGFGHAILCFRKGIGFRVGTTEPEFERRVNEHLASRGIKPQPHGDTHELRDDLPEKTEHHRYSNPQIDQAATDLGLGETEYRLNWLPLGGYVKMLGQEDIGDQATAASQDPRSFGRKPIWARLVVISAGVVMNAIFAVVFFIAAFMYGVEFPPAIIGDVEPGSPAATTPAQGHPDIVGLQPGDMILTVNDEPPMDFVDLAVASALAARGDKVKVAVERPGSPGTDAARYEFLIEPEDTAGKLRAIGVGPPFDIRLATPDSKSTEAWQERFGKTGLRPGMVLTRVNDQPVTAFYQLDHAANRAAGQPITLTFTDGQGNITLTQSPSTSLAADDAQSPQPTAPVPHMLGLVPPLKIGSVVKDMPAHGQLREGDIVLKINDFDFPTWQQAMETIPATTGGKPVEFTVLRDGQPVTITVTPRNRKIGVVFNFATDTAYVASGSSGPFKPLELIAPARIESIAGQPVKNYTDVRMALAAAAGDQVEVGYLLPGTGGQERRETRTVTITATHRAELAAIPWTLDLPPFTDLRTVQKADNAWQALDMGFHKSWVMMIQTYQTLRALFGRTVPVSELRGPVGIADAGTQFAKRGWTYLMFFLGVISVNLAVLNFLPIPILDGGLAVLLIAEKVRGKPVPVQVQNALTLIGAGLLLTLVLFVTYNDIWRLINS